MTTRQNPDRFYPSRSAMNSQIRVICFPYSGGSASIFNPWIEHMPHSIEVCPVQYPGHGNKMGELLTDDINDLVESIMKGYSDLFNEKPFAFFGYSLGALVAYELSTRLHESKTLIPVHLFVSAHRAPHLPDRNISLHELEDQIFLEKIIELGGMDREIIRNSELVDLMVPILKADFKMCETYKFKERPPLNCPITVLGGLDDPYVTRSELQAWEKQTTKAFSVRMLPGNHFFMRQAQHYLLQVITRELYSFLM